MQVFRSITLGHHLGASLFPQPFPIIWANGLIVVGHRVPSSLHACDEVLPFWTTLELIPTMSQCKGFAHMLGLECQQSLKYLFDNPKLQTHIDMDSMT